MSPEHEPGSDHCWKHIGVWGDRSCPELTTHPHCRGCPVYAQAGRRIFDREPAAGYRATWRHRLAEPLAPDRGETVSVLVFGLASETFALRTLHLAEVVRTRTVRRLPHRDSSVLHGLVNVHGLLRPCVSMAAVLGVGAGDAADDTARDTTDGPARLNKRMLVARAGGGPLVTPVDAAHGTYRVAETAMRPPPATVSGDTSRFTTAVFRWRERDVGLLDGAALFAALEAQLS